MNIAKSASPPPPSSGFPQNPEEFDADPRVSFSKLSNKFLLETDDGQEYEFDDGLKRWVPVVRRQSPITKLEGLHASISILHMLSYASGRFLTTMM